MENFLKDRDIPADVVEKFTSEKVDVHVVSCMTDEQLKDMGITHFGDRVAIKSFASSATTKEKEVTSEHYLGKLKRKALGWQSLKGNDNAKKEKRKLEIGWLMKKSSETSAVQVRSRKGGGTRGSCYELALTIQDIQNEAVGMFFPGGESLHHGRLDEYRLKMINFDSSPLQLDETLEQIMKRTNMRPLRVYLQTEKKPEHSSLNKQGKDSSQEGHNVTPPKVGSVSDDELPDLTRMPRKPKTRPVTYERQPIMVTDVASEIPPKAPTFQNNVSQEQDDAINLAPLDTSVDSDIIFGAHIADLGDNSIPLDILDFVPSASSSVIESRQPKEICFRLHRGHVFPELLKTMKESPDINPTVDNITFKLVSESGKEEVADDNGGVCRDALTEFWETFYETTTMGSEIKVPYLRHDFEAADWQAMAHVFVMGWKLQRMYPVRLSTSFLSSCIHVHLLVTDEAKLTKEFMHFLSPSERQILELAMSNFDEVDQSELLDVLQSYECKVAVSAANVRNVIVQLAHKELVQKPSYVKECFSDVFTLMELDIDLSERDVYMPSAKKVLSIMKFDDVSRDTSVVHNLKRYIRELDDGNLRKFLRFTTGSDLMLRDMMGDYLKIHISVICIPEENKRRPIAHTCGRLLEIPRNYETLMELRRAFTFIFKLGDFMDTV